MYRQFLLLVMGVCMTSALFHACSSSTESPTSAAVYLPLAVGNTWIYRVTVLDTNGVAMRVSYDTARVVKDSTVDGEHCYYVSNMPAMNGWMSNHTDGLWVWARAKSSGSQWQKWYASPAKKGDSTLMAHDFNVPRAVDSTIVTALGPKKCTVINVEDVYIDYVCSGIGTVRGEWWYSSPPSVPYYNWEVYELMSYQLK